MTREGKVDFREFILSNLREGTTRCEHTLRDRVPPYIYVFRCDITKVDEKICRIENVENGMKGDGHYYFPPLILSDSVLYNFEANTVEDDIRLFKMKERTDISLLGVIRSFFTGCPRKMGG